MASAPKNQRLASLSLEGQVAAVTGGTRGLGLVIAQTLAGFGCAVAVCGRTAPEKPLDFAQFHQADIRDPEAAAAFVDSVVSSHGRIDILVNNAGGSPQTEAAVASPRFADAIVGLNLMGPFFLAQAAHRHMKAQGAGSIVNIASVSGARPSPGTALYGAAKAGLINLTQSLAQEWGPDGVRVNAIIVGLAATETAEQTYGGPDSQAKVARSLPLRRMAVGEDVANAVLYLCSPLASYVSGARLQVDGGGERPLFIDLVSKA